MMQVLSDLLWENSLKHDSSDTENMTVTRYMPSDLQIKQDCGRYDRNMA